MLMDMNKPNVEEVAASSAGSIEVQCREIEETDEGATPGKVTEKMLMNAGLLHKRRGGPQKIKPEYMELANLIVQYPKESVRSLAQRTSPPVIGGGRNRATNIADMIRQYHER